MFCHFITFSHLAAGTSLHAHELDRFVEQLRQTRQLKRAQLLFPAVARDRYIDDGPAPLLTVQLYFEQLDALESAAGSDGALLRWANALPVVLAQAQIVHQVMWTRRYPTPTAPVRLSRGTSASCFLVHYPGSAEDLNRWHNYYLEHHPQIMYRFPEIREIEIYTRVDWRDALPWQRASYFQRNRVAFDSAAALEHALHSPVRDEMKRDRAAFPPFTGGNVHHAVNIETVVGPVFGVG